MWCVTVYYETDDEQIHDRDITFFNTEVEAKIFEKALYEYRVLLIEKNVYSTFEINCEEIKPKPFDEIMKETSELYDSLLEEWNYDE